MQGLPSHRDVLTSLIHAIAQTSSPSQPPRQRTHVLQQTSDENGGEPSGEPASRLLASSGISSSDTRHRLLTLHVLMPNLLLPALDLLDRQLVTRVQLKAGDAAGDASAQLKRESTNPTSQDGGERPAHGEPAVAVPPPPTQSSVYVVRSLASTMTRRGRDALSATSTSTTYLVRLGAWNCSCTSFSFDAFPATHASGPATNQAHRQPEPSMATKQRPATGSFGGFCLSVDHEAAMEGAPCCKHLLACLLAETCGRMLDGQVEERTVTKEEMAGIIVGTC